MGEGQGSGKDGDGKSFVALLCALLCPPVAVFFVDGCSCRFFLNIVLTLLFWIPGMLHAFWVILRENE